MKKGSIEMLKGRIAEAIVEEMLQEAGFQVYRFGYEAVIQNLTQVGTRLKKTRAGRKILHMPDFIDSTVSKIGSGLSIIPAPPP